MELGAAAESRRITLPSPFPTFSSGTKRTTNLVSQRVPKGFIICRDPQIHNPIPSGSPESCKQFGISAFNCKFSPHSISEHMHPLPLTGQKPPSCVSSLVLQCSCMLRKNIFAIQACHVAVCFNTMILPSRQIYLSFKFKLPTKVTKPCISLALFPC